MKGIQGTVHQRLGPLLGAVHGHFTARELIADLCRRLPPDLEILMVHSAYDRMVPMFRGGPGDVVAALRELVGPQCTIAMPAFVMGGRDEDVRGYFGVRPFDLRRTPSELGIITEVFRRMPGTRRSLHPTASICAQGPLAEQMVAGHHLAADGLGPGTPFGFMNRHRTAILGLGVEYFRCLTHAHTAASEMGAEFPVRHDPVEIMDITLVDDAGQRIPYRLGVRDTEEELDLTLLWSLLSRDELREWRYHGIPMFLVADARTVTDRLIEAARCGVTIYGRVAPELVAQ